MGTCRICEKNSSIISRELGLCLECIRRLPGAARKIALEVHARIRDAWGLQGEAPRNAEGIACNLCVNRCRIREGEWGYFGLRRNYKGRLEGVRPPENKQRPVCMLLRRPVSKG